MTDLRNSRSNYKCIMLKGKFTGTKPLCIFQSAGFSETALTFTRRSWHWNRYSVDSKVSAFSLSVVTGMKVSYL